MYNLWINVSAYYAWFAKALQSSYTAEAMQSSPYCLAKWSTLLPRMTISENKKTHQSKLLTSLACNAQKIITSKSPDFKILLYTKPLQCCHVPNRVSTTNLKRIFYSIGKTLPLAVFCPWEWKGSSNSWPYCSNWLQ